MGNTLSLQDVLSLSNHSETLDALRSKIQFHSEIRYVFAGSVRNQMSGIFTDPESSFFESATVIEIDPLKKNVFALDKCETSRVPGRPQLRSFRSESL